MSIRAFLLLALCALALACSSGSEQPPPAPDGGRPAELPKLPFLELCQTSVECEEGYCLEVGPNYRICTQGCTSDRECPSGENWGCGTTRELEEPLCLCLASGPEQCGDGRDNDCNGRTDNCLTCGGRQIAPDSRLHCGACDRACPAGSVCRDEQCVCPGGAPLDSCSSPDAPECVTDLDCSDDNRCTADRCKEGECVWRLAEEPCGPGESCDLRSGRCEAGEACASDADCADSDACTTGERCDLSLKVCVHGTLDGDEDRDAPSVCGGLDCDDDDRDSANGLPESCDGKDNDCNGKVDDESALAMCEEGRACSEGECRCAGETTECLFTCVDTSTDNQHCGSCKNACDTGAQCVAGVCECPVDTLSCEGECRPAVWFEENVEHCGSCNAACTLAGTTCVNGACECEGGGQECGGACVDTDGSFYHCGGCNLACQFGQSCVEGVCSCPPGQTFCAGAGCVDLTSHEGHCGSCTNSCNPSELCSAGSCTCPDGQTSCNGTCVNTQIDESHCGACGELCPAAQSCLGGECSCPVSGQVLCGASCVDTQTSESHCGACGEVCPVAQSCLGGECSCPVSGQVLCGASCVDTQTSESHCGACGEACPLAQSCLGGECSCPVSGQVLCGATCVDTDTNTTHCGSCDNRCARCTDGECARVQKVFAQSQSTCTLSSDGEAHCWGFNQNGELGDGTTQMRTRPVNVLRSAGVRLDGITDVQCKSPNCCALLDTGHLHCWGWNVFGQRGDGSAVGTASLYATRVETAAGVPLQGIAQFAPGARQCALLTSGEVFCWGQGPVGNGTTDHATRPVRVETAAGVPLTGVAKLENGFLTCAIMQSGRAMCWGTGNIGNGASSATRPAFVETAPGVPLEGVASIRSGTEYSCAALTNGQAYCWGGNGSGQLGNGSTDSAARAVRVEVAANSPLTSVAEVIATYNRSCARTTAGEVYCWGTGDSGALGNGGTSQSLRPVRVEVAAGVPLSNVVALELDWWFGCARTEAADLYCWGNAPVGDGTVNNALRPKKIQGGITAMSVSSGHVCSQLSWGSVSCWRSNTYGQIGNYTSGAAVRSPYTVWP